jgi:hypothetical protein
MRFSELRAGDLYIESWTDLSVVFCVIKIRVAGLYANLSMLNTSRDIILENEFHVDDEICYSAEGPRWSVIRKGKLIGSAATQ